MQRPHEIPQTLCSGLGLRLTYPLSSSMLFHAILASFCLGSFLLRACRRLEGHRQSIYISCAKHLGGVVVQVVEAQEYLGIGKHWMNKSLSYGQLRRRAASISSCHICACAVPQHRCCQASISLGCCARNCRISCSVDSTLPRAAHPSFCHARYSRSTNSGARLGRWTKT